MPKKGYRQTAEHKAKIAESLRGRPHTKARRRKISRGVHRHYEQRRQGHS